MAVYLRIGNILIRIESAPQAPAVELPAAYLPFVVENVAETPHGIMRIADESTTPVAPAESARVVATGFNDLGESRLFFDGSTYCVGISPCPGERMQFMEFSADFRMATLSLVPSCRWNSFLLDSMLRIFFSQVAVLESAFLIHSSAVETPLGAHLFMGKSGTGKSTHSSLWLKTFDDCRLLNDDNPLVTLHPSGVLTVHGTPWSGKTPCWLNRSATLLSLTRLSQAPANRYTPLADIQAFIAVLPGVSVISHSKKLYDRVCRTVGSAVSASRVGLLECLPDSAAAILCRQNTEENQKTPIIIQ